MLDPLRDAKVPVMVLSTFDTDYVMVKQTDLDKAIRVLKDAGHIIR